MYLSIDFDYLLTQNVEEIILWFEEEIDIIFKNKRKFSNRDIHLGILIIENLVRFLKVYQNDQLLDLLTSRLSYIRKKYPDFF